MRFIACITLLCSAHLFAQNRSTGDATARGTCNIAISGTGNTITVTTCGKDQTDELQKLLRSIASNQQTDTATILKKLDECLQTMADRHLTESQKATLFAAISSLPGHNIAVSIPFGNSEAKAFALDFVELFRKAKWTGLDGSGVNNKGWDNDPVGITVAISANDAVPGRVPPDATFLMNALISIGVANQRTRMIAAKSIGTGQVELAIGIKPPQGN